MKAWGRIEVSTIATLSTGHIPSQDRDIIEDAIANDNSDAYEHTHWVRDLTWISYKYGYLVSGTSLRRVKKENPDSLPDHFKEMAQMAEDLNLGWILFDVDGDIVDELVNFDD